jgi:CheY-like chemotaxis protein
MFWKILLELLLVLIMFFAGASFWSCLKAPRHLHNLLSDPVELSRFIDHFGYDKLRAEAQQVQAPPFGTFGDTIDIWEAAHYKSLSQTRNGLLVVVLAALAASWWLGMAYLGASLSVFLLLGFLAEAGRNNNADHLHSLMLNLVKWHREDERACEGFCHRQDPEYRTLHDLLLGRELEMVVASREEPERILVVDDEEGVRETLCAMLRPAGYECHAVAGVMEALDLLESGEKFDLLISGVLRLPADGLALLKCAKENFPRIPVMIATATSDVSVAIASVRSGADEFITLPADRERFLARVSCALKRKRGG